MSANQNAQKLANNSPFVVAKSNTGHQYVVNTQSKLILGRVIGFVSSLGAPIDSLSQKPNVPLPNGASCYYVQDENNGFLALQVHDSGSKGDGVKRYSVHDPLAIERPRILVFKNPMPEPTIMP